MFSKSLHFKILSLVSGVIFAGVLAAVLYSQAEYRRDLMDEKLRSSRLMADAILHSIYEDMLQERADMARHLVDGLSTLKDVERVQIIRSNGVEEAFRDYKTIEAVKEEFGETRPEWMENHENVAQNRAEGIDAPEFKAALKSFMQSEEVEESYYTEQRNGKKLFTYLHPIEARSKCNSCHNTEGARGILMITTSLADMDAAMSKRRNQWILFDIAGVLIGGLLLSILVRKSITGPLSKTVKVIKGITEGRGALTDRVNVSSRDEVGYLASAFNSMLDSLQKRDEANRRLFSTVIKSREEWVATFDAIQDLIAIVDRDDRITRANTALATRLGKRPEDLVNRNCCELFYGADADLPSCPHKRTLATGEVITEVYEDLPMPGVFQVTTYPIIDEAGDAVSTVHVAKDVTEETRLKEKLLHAEKMNSIGKFVAGIAHELNNPLMGIMGFSQLLMEMPGERRLADVRDKLAKIYNESTRTAKLVQNLLTFGRERKSDKRPHDVNEILKDTMELKRHHMDSNSIGVVMRLDANLPPVLTDTYQMQQVFVNILNNAIDAMVHSNGEKRMEIETRLEKRHVVIRMRDSGPGIPADIMGRIFDPFFTTKEVGKGTGLGLSIVHGIIEEHGGTIAVDSPEEGGTVFTISLPATTEDAGRPLVQKKTEARPSPATGAGRAVLIVDDEPSIREALSQSLAYEGFKVETACDGFEALELLGLKRFDAVITDIKMPNMSGIELYRKVIEADERLRDRVVLLTGDVLSQDIKEFLQKTDTPYMLKPFDPRELIELINRVLL